MNAACTLLLPAAQPLSLPLRISEHKFSLNNEAPDSLAQAFEIGAALSLMEERENWALGSGGCQCSPSGGSDRATTTITTITTIQHQTVNADCENNREFKHVHQISVASSKHQTNSAFVGYHRIPFTFLQSSYSMYTYKDNGAECPF